MTDRRPARDAAALAAWACGADWPEAGWLVDAASRLVPLWGGVRARRPSPDDAARWARSVVEGWVAAGVYGAAPPTPEAEEADTDAQRPSPGRSGEGAGAPGRDDGGEGAASDGGEPAEGTAAGGVVSATEAQRTAADGAGSAPGVWGRSDPGDVLAWAEALARAPDVVALIARLGRRAQQGLPPEGGREIVGVGLGRRVSQAVPATLALIDDPDFDAVFWRQLAEGRLLSWSRGGEGEGGEAGHARRGPALLALDTSASMAGARGLVARAVTVAVARALRAEGRAVRLVAFGAQGEHAALPLDDDPASWVRLLAWGFQGGTDLDGPVVRALAEHGEADGGDLVLVTDGEASLDPRTVAAAEAAHRDRGWSLELVLVSDAHLAVRSVLEPAVSAC